MGYDAEKAQDLADQVLFGTKGLAVESGRIGSAGFGPEGGPTGFDAVDDILMGGTGTPADPMRPEAVRGRYRLPHPVTGKPTSWTRVTNFIKLADNTYHLELWKQRNVAKGLAMRPEWAAEVQGLEVKADKARLNKICEDAQRVAGAYRMSDEGTALHKSAEIADYADGSIERVKASHRDRINLYLETLAANGLSVVPGMIERVVVSTRYGLAGKFDRIYQLSDGSYVIGDLKTSDSLDLSMPAISGQLAAYEDAINENGVWDGLRYDTRIRVRKNFGLVIHLPSTRYEATVYEVDLAPGHDWNRVCDEVRTKHKVKAKDVSRVFDPNGYKRRDTGTEDLWARALDSARVVRDLHAVANVARAAGQWTEALAAHARRLAKELENSSE